MNPCGGTNRGLLTECGQTVQPWAGHLSHANNSTYKYENQGKEYVCLDSSNEYTNANYDRNRLPSDFHSVSITFVSELHWDSIHHTKRYLR